MVTLLHDSNTAVAIAASLLQRSPAVTHSTVRSVCNTVTEFCLPACCSLPLSYLYVAKHGTTVCLRHGIQSTQLTLCYSIKCSDDVCRPFTRSSSGPLHKKCGAAVPLHVIKAYMAGRGVAPLTLNCGTRRRCQLHAPAALLQGRASCTN